MLTINYYEIIKAHPETFTQLVCKELLFAYYKCPAVDRFIGKWSQHNYIVFVLTGKMAYHTPGKSRLIKAGDAIYVKRGAVVMEKFYEEFLCLMSFHIPDTYLRSFLREHHECINLTDPTDAHKDLVMPLQVTDLLNGYFASLIPYFHAPQPPSEDLLELKFRELLLHIITNPANQELKSYLPTVMAPTANGLQEIMEANCLFNLPLESFAKMCNRSLSSFKRDFYAAYKTNPGQWLLTQKLNYSHKQLLNTNKSVSDICFECGFENSTHFSKAFKKQFGMSPMQYRQHAMAS